MTTTLGAPIGHATLTAESQQIVFTRRYNKPVEKVWAAITIPERLAAWLAFAEFEPKAGGAINLVWGDNANTMQGRVLAYEPTRLFSWTWTLDGRETVVRFELAPDGDDTVLTLTHSGLAPNHGPGGGVRAGWHAHLDALPGALEGRATSLEETHAHMKQDLVALYPLPG